MSSTSSRSPVLVLTPAMQGYHAHGLMPRGFQESSWSDASFEDALRYVEKVSTPDDLFTRQSTEDIPEGPLSKRARFKRGLEKTLTSLRLKRKPEPSVDQFADTGISESPESPETKRNRIKRAWNRMLVGLRIKRPQQSRIPMGLDNWLALYGLDQARLSDEKSLSLAPSSSHYSHGAANSVKTSNPDAAQDEPQPERKRVRFNV